MIKLWEKRTVDRRRETLLQFLPPTWVHQMRPHSSDRDIFIRPAFNLKQLLAKYPSGLLYGLNCWGYCRPEITTASLPLLLTGWLAKYTHDLNFTRLANKIHKYIFNYSPLFWSLWGLTTNSAYSYPVIKRDLPHQILWFEFISIFRNGGGL